MDWSVRLTQAIDYLEENLERTVRMEKAAELANCSLFHFCRMFAVVFGISPGDYVRRRRLSRAALELAAGEAKVIDVALRYGYDSPESFAKAFRRCFGMTPSEARLAGSPLETWPPARVAVILGGDKSMKYRIVEKPAFTVTGLTLRTTHEENREHAVISKFWERNAAEGAVGALAERAGEMGMLGVCYDYKPSDEHFSYAIAIETPASGSVGLPAACATITVPKATYAVFEAVGQIPDSIAACWNSIYTEWFPSSGYEHSGSPDFEVYKGEAGEATGCEVWVPIKKAK